MDSEKESFATELGKGALSAATLVSAVYLTAEGISWVLNKARRLAGDAPRTRRRTKNGRKNTAKAAASKRTVKRKKQPRKQVRNPVVRKKQRTGHDSPRAMIG